MRIVRFFTALTVIAVAAVPTTAGAKVLVEIDKSAQRMVVSVDGVQRHSWPVSTGRLGHDTPAGSHRAFRMERDHFSKEWDDAPMPHSIFFTQKGHAIHGSLETKKIGSPASAGCVRLAPENAAQLFALVEQQGVLNTTVVITGDLQVALARSAQRTAATTGNQTRQAPRAPEPLPISPDYEYYGQRRPATRYVEPEELGAYAARMRPRYYEERAQAPRYDERPYYAPRRYQDPRPYYAEQPYYSRRSYPYAWD